MRSVTENYLATIVLDIAAVLILFGVIYYTSHYRKRNRTDDKLYFAMVIMTMICAVSNAAAFAVDTGSGKVFYALAILFTDIFFITMDLSFWLLAVYFDHRSQKNAVFSKKRAAFLALPAILTAIIIFINHGAHFLFWMDEATETYIELSYFPIIYVAPLIYAAIIVCINIANKGSLFVLIMLIAARIVLAYVMHNISSTALFIAIVLVFTHINEMRYAFYTEERNAAEIKEGV